MFVNRVSEENVCLYLFLLWSEESRVASRLVDGPVSVKRIYTDLVELGPSFIECCSERKKFP